MVRDVRLAGVIQGQEEIDAVMRVMNTNPPWHVSGEECSALQKELAEYFGVKHALVVNSGSSANLLALASLNLPKWAEVLTSACGFPATLNPAIHLGYKPFLIDYDIETFNVDLSQIEKALSKSEYIKVMMFAHTLGESLDMDYLMWIKNKYDLFLIEDACEAIGTKWGVKYVGSFGDINTVSFYASHQMSGFGGGGALLTNNTDLYERAKSLRDWGKESVREGYICTKMDSMVGDMPYDQQYTYNTIGYNMRYPDANCAYAREQLKRLAGFSFKRRGNYNILDGLLGGLPILRHRSLYKSLPSSFGFPLVLSKEGLRDKFVQHLEDNGVHVRLFFAGNIVKHSPYQDLDYGSLNNKQFPVADYLMRNGLFCGCWPGLSEEDMKYIATVVRRFFE